MKINGNKENERCSERLRPLNTGSRKGGRTLTGQRENIKQQTQIPPPTPTKPLFAR